MIKKIRAKLIRLRFFLLGTRVIKIIGLHAPEKGPLQVIGSVKIVTYSPERKAAFEEAWLKFQVENNTLFLQGDHVEWKEVFF
jgi:hypothetical protein